MRLALDVRRSFFFRRVQRQALGVPNGAADPQPGGASSALTAGGQLDVTLASQIGDHVVQAVVVRWLVVQVVVAVGSGGEVVSRCCSRLVGVVKAIFNGFATVGVGGGAVIAVVCGHSLVLHFTIAALPPSEIVALLA